MRNPKMKLKTPQNVDILSYRSIQTFSPKLPRLEKKTCGRVYTVPKTKIFILNNSITLARIHTLRLHFNKSYPLLLIPRNSKVNYNNQNCTPAPPGGGIGTKW